MTIEERLLRDQGTTEDPHLAIWLLKDGTLVNGSIEGRQRDVDHHEIGQYFKKSKFQEPGSSLIYIKKFERRGNVRWGCSETGYWAELRATPTQEQFNTIVKHFTDAARNRIDNCVVIFTRRGRKIQTDVYGLMNHVERYTNLTVPVED